MGQLGQHDVSTFSRHAIPVAVPDDRRDVLLADHVQSLTIYRPEKIDHRLKSSVPLH